MCEQFGDPQIMNSSPCMNCAFFKPDYFNLCNLYYKNKNMDKKEVKIEIPKGYEIDKEKSTFEKIVFKPIVRSWRYTVDEHAIVKGWFIDFNGKTWEIKDAEKRNKLFATEKQAQSALAMAQISQIMANDKRFGGVVTDEEWKKGNGTVYFIERFDNRIVEGRNYVYNINYRFLAFHTEGQRDLFLKENEDLVKDYLMID